MTDTLKYGIQPFWFWNGDMEEKEIRRQIHEMADKGIRGFFIHPRQGMELPYLSKEYFERVKTAVYAAKEYGLEVWLYDEYPYPSGISGGEVILDHPEYLCKELKKVIKEVSGGREVHLFAPWGKLISAKAYRILEDECDFTDFIDLTEYVGTGYRQEIFQLNGLTDYNKKRYFTGDPGKKLMWTPPEGKWRIYLFVETVMEHFKYFKNFVDPLNPRAVRYFLETTHERYKKYVGDEFGKTIKGVFTDEVTAFPPGQPWSPLLPQLVQKLHGIDLITYLPALWEDMGELTSRVRYAYWNAATEGFIESYDKSIYRWCEENHLLYVGEKPIMRSKELEFVHVPGIDTGHQKVGSKAEVVGAGYRANGKIISSAAHFYRKSAALCEAFHSIGWGMTLQDMKWTFDWLALQGVDWYVIHAFYYTADALKKHDAPPSAFYQMPWWKDMKILSDYAVGLGDFLRSLKRTVKILVIDPATSTWTADAGGKERLRRDFAQMQNRMLEESFDYYIADPQLFGESRVKLKTSGNRNCVAAEINGEEYDVVVLPPMTNLEDIAANKLAEYVRAGGKVCGVSCLPYEKIENMDTAAVMKELFLRAPIEIAEIYHGKKLQEYITKARPDTNLLTEKESKTAPSQENPPVFFARNTAQLLDWLKKNVHMDFNIIPKDDLGYGELGSLQGETKDGREVFVMNLSNKERIFQIQFREKREGMVCLQPYESRRLKESDLRRRESDLRQYRGSLKTGPAVEAGKKEIYNLDIRSRMKITPLGRNALRLSLWKAEFPDGQTATVDSFPLFDQLEQARILMPVRSKAYFGCPKEPEFTGVPVVYRQEFICAPADGEKEDIYLVMEPGTFLGQWRLSLNQKVLTEKDFAVTPIYSNTNLGLMITPYLKTGRNEIKIWIHTDAAYGGIRNPLYLFGKFAAVKKGGVWNLDSAVTEGYMDDPVGNGLPFFAGTVLYEKRVEDMRCDGDSLWIGIKDMWLEDAVGLRVNDYEAGVCAFRPYEFEIPKKYISKEGNLIKIYLDTTAAGLFEGEIFNREKHCYESIEEIEDSRYD